jgi:hypothetical protein
LGVDNETSLKGGIEINNYSASIRDARSFAFVRVLYLPVGCAFGVLERLPREAEAYPPREGQQYIYTEKPLQYIQMEEMVFVHAILVKFSFIFHLIITHSTITQDKIEEHGAEVLSPT